MSEKARTAAEDRADAVDSVAGNCADCGEPARGTWGGDAFCAAHMRAALEAAEERQIPTCPECHAEVERVGLVCPTCEAQEAATGDRRCGGVGDILLAPYYPRA
jgi:hypothetical protein